MTDKNKTRTINTNFYGSRAFEILEAVSGQMSDGMWENSRGYDKYWMNFRVKQLEDNRVVFVLNADSYTRDFRSRWLDNPFYGMKETEFLAWYAGKLKTVIREEAKDNNWPKGWWKRDNTENKSIYLNYKLDITVADIYCVYDELLGRQTRADEEIRNRVFGQKANDVTIAKRVELAKAKAKAEADYKEHVAMLDEKVKKFMAEIDADKQQAYKVYREVVARYDAAVEFLEKKYDVA